MADRDQSDAPPPHPLLTEAEISRMAETAIQHRLNKNALRHTKSLSKATGMMRVGVHLVRLEPGQVSTEYHFHHHEEEFVYILTGRGETEIGKETHPVAAGDFMGFSAPSPPHVLRNSSDEDLVYLVGGQSLADDVTEYPRMGKTMYKVRGKRQVVDRKNIENL